MTAAKRISDEQRAMMIAVLDQAAAGFRCGMRYDAEAVALRFDQAKDQVRANGRRIAELEAALREAASEMACHAPNYCSMPGAKCRACMVRTAALAALNPKEPSRD